MKIDKTINNHKLSLLLGDITDLDVEAFVFYATDNLELGSGYGNAISMRGGPTIKKELDKIGSVGKTEAVVSGAGELKAKYIVHANGPKFQEEKMLEKLETTILNSLKSAQAKGIKQVALPPMGAGFYGVPLPDCAKTMTKAISGYLQNGVEIDEVVIVVMDNREWRPFEAEFKSIN